MFSNSCENLYNLNHIKMLNTQWKFWFDLVQYFQKLTKNLILRWFLFVYNLSFIRMLNIEWEFSFHLICIFKVICFVYILDKNNNNNNIILIKCQKKDHHGNNGSLALDHMLPSSSPLRQDSTPQKGHTGVLRRTRLTSVLSSNREQGRICLAISSGVHAPIMDTKRRRYHYATYVVFYM